MGRGDFRIGFENEFWVGYLGEGMDSSQVRVNIGVEAYLDCQKRNGHSNVGSKTRFRKEGC